MKTSRQQIFAQASRKLRQDFSELTAIPHAALKGGEAERLVCHFIRDHIPKRFDVGSGFILDPFDTVSKQTDVIIYDALNCPTYRASVDAGIYPSQNVAGVVEVKSKLDKEKLLGAIKNIQAVKQLRKVRAPEYLGKVSQTFGCLFAFESAISLETIASHYCDFLRAREFEIGTHIDTIVVLDTGIITMQVRPRGMPWGRYFHETAARSEISEGMGFALGIEAAKEDALDAFLRDILSRVALFWGVVDHPGFNWSSDEKQQIKLQFLATICTETDPQKRQQLNDKYAAEVCEEFNGMNEQR